MLIEVLATFLGLLWLVLIDGGFGDIGHVFRVFCQDVVDFGSLVAILLLTLPVFFRRGIRKDFTNAVRLQSNKFSCSLGEMKKAQYAVEFIQKQLLYAGVVTLLYGLISVFNNADLEFSYIIVGACVSIALICPLYAAILELVILPLEIGLKGRIADYMEEE